MFGSYLGRAAMGAAAGGILGGASSGSWSGAFGGALAGGAAAGTGWGAMSKYGPRALGRGARMAGRGLERLGGRLSSGAFDMSVLGAAKGWGQMGLNRAASGMRNAASLLGNSKTMTNKWGGRVMAGIGVGSAAMLGSSVISSNRGY